MKILVASLAWPPACYVSDATDRSGRFWWHSYMLERRPFWSLSLKNALIPWPIYMLLLAVESAISFSLIYNKLEKWAEPYFKIAVTVQILWYLFAAIWVATVHICAGLAYEDDLGRRMARRELDDSKNTNNSRKGGDGKDTANAASAKVEKDGTNGHYQHKTLPPNFNITPVPETGPVPPELRTESESPNREDSINSVHD